MNLHGDNLKEWQDAARRDDVLDVLVPSDIRGMLGEIGRLRAALKLAKRMNDEALPKFDWGKSALDANAIQLLNDAPIAINKALNPEAGK